MQVYADSWSDTMDIVSTDSSSVSSLQAEQENTEWTLRSGPSIVDRRLERRTGRRSEGRGSTLCRDTLDGEHSGSVRPGRYLMLRGGVPRS